MNYVEQERNVALVKQEKNDGYLFNKQRVLRHGGSICCAYPKLIIREALWFLKQLKEEIFLNLILNLKVAVRNDNEIEIHSYVRHSDTDSQHM